MRRLRVFFVVVSVLLLLAVPASAQDYPKVEIFWRHLLCQRG